MNRIILTRSSITLDCSRIGENVDSIITSCNVIHCHGAVNIVIDTEDKSEYAIVVSSKDTYMCIYLNCYTMILQILNIMVCQILY